MMQVFQMPVIKNFIEKNPRLWNLAWNILHKSKLFLPHDPTYFCLNYLSNNNSKLILDIGANQGISSLSFRKLCPSLKIIAFEPNTIHKTALNSLKSNLSNFEVHFTGLGDEVGEFLLFTPRYKSIYLHTFSSLNHNSVVEAITKTYSPKTVKQITIEKSFCKISRLDDFNFKPDIIKIDAEGHESKIIRGGIETINQSKPSIIFEACHDDLRETLNLLHSLGYEFYYYTHTDHQLNKLSKEQSYNHGMLNYQVSGNRNLIAIHSLNKM